MALGFIENIKDFRTVATVIGFWSDAPTHGCMLIEPPKEFGGLDTIVNKPVVLNEAVGLLPESNFGGVAKIPTVANNSVLTRR